VDASQEVRVLIGMVTDVTVLSAVAQSWDPEYFDSPWAATVGGWCVEHYEKYGRAPDGDIKGYFTRWADQERDKDKVTLVEDFLSQLAHKHLKQKESLSSEFLIEVARESFQRAKVKKTCEDALLRLDRGEVDKAVTVLDRWSKPQVGGKVGLDLFQDQSVVTRVFARKSEPPLVQYPDALGHFFAPALRRGKLISFMGREKIGKSYILQDLAFRALEQAHPVAYFEMGDSDEVDVMARFCVRACGRPFDRGRYDIPVSIEVEEMEDGKSKPHVETCRKVEKEDMTEDEAAYLFRKTSERLSAQLKLVCYPNSEGSVRDVRTHLETWGREGWSPSLVIVDYPDIMAPVDRKADRRDQINDTWKGLRAISQRFHCLVVTTTQIKSSGFDKYELDLEDYSEEKRKYSHVNGMVAINQMVKSEKPRGIYRLKWLLLRELDFSEKRVCWCAGNLAYGDPFMVSTF
jgi:hypothetical protein